MPDTNAVTDFYNGALGLIGQDSITSIDEDTTAAHWCRTYGPKLRQAILRSHFWNFAENRMELPQEAEAPLFEFALAFGLPPDLVRVKEFNGHAIISPSNNPDYWMYVGGRYKIETNDEGKRLLYTNDSQAFIVYVQDIENPNRWDPLFYQCYQHWLAAELALAIPKDARKAKDLMGIAINILLPFATAVDGQEASTLAYHNDTLTRGRDF